MECSKRVVITGVGIICALGHNRFEVFENMKQNKTSIGNMTRFSTEKFISQMGAEVKEFVPDTHFSKNEQEKYDLTAQYGIVAINEALEDSKWNHLTKRENVKIGLAYGTCNGGINSLEASENLDNVSPSNLRKYPFFQQADTIANHFTLNGPVNTMNTACAASGNAIGYAYDLLKDGYCDVMIAGGSDTMSLSVYAGFNTLQALNSKPCSPYNTEFGLSLGEGAAFVIMETLESAQKRGCTVYAEVCGYGLSNDAHHETAPDPKGKGIQRAIEMALKSSSVPKEKIGYINTHGTGTPANDPAEINGIRGVFGVDLFSKIPISSSKSYFGHNLGAAASIEYVTTLLALQKDLLPATLHFEKAREGCEDINLVANEMRVGKPEYFLCNNSAFGGHNCSIVSRTMSAEEVTPTETQTENNQRVVIVGMGIVHRDKYKSGSIVDWFSDITLPSEESFSLKAYNKNLYKRRMNSLTQFSIGAIDLALKDAELEITNENESDIGLVYGTARGSLQSATKYLQTIFDKGPEFASGIYFPDMVLNSTAGKVSKVLGIKGYSSSQSAGGNDGLLSTLNAFQVIKNNIQPYCITAAGDECSELSSEIDKAYGLHTSSFTATEGASSLILTSYQQATQQKKKMYAEILGIGVSFSEHFNQSYITAMEQALQNAKIDKEELDFIFYNSIGLQSFDEKSVIAEFINDKNIPIQCFNDKLGYAQSFSCLNHVYIAVDAIYYSNHYLKNQVDEVAVITDSFEGYYNNNQLKKGMVISSSINGNSTAIILSSIN
ncbi:beta-ketoacyl synthase N-terminal-like domain-containing protein [Evansella sp. AB-rgal1]|uniref:beta-ketoacyl synthase N-terminal-like domain-containing protein n=1 Tax=Evansella sp. AB-rgal1 TaxID=3242696 RepID=UPI00359D9FC0